MGLKRAATSQSAEGGPRFPEGTKTLLWQPPGDWWTRHRGGPAARPALPSSRIQPNDSILKPSGECHKRGNLAGLPNTGGGHDPPPRGSFGVRTESKRCARTVVNLRKREFDGRGGGESKWEVRQEKTPLLLQPDRFGETGHKSVRGDDAHAGKEPSASCLGERGEGHGARWD